MEFFLAVLPEIKETRYLGLDWSLLSILGLLGNAMWSLRFLLQWIASERKKESVIPLSFWYVSIAGTMFSLTYFILKRDPVGILAFLPNTAIYLRNIHLTKRKASRVSVED